MNIIYALRDPFSDEYMYVGKSINGVQRAKSHFTKSHNLLVEQWVLSLMAQDEQPIIDILEECDSPLMLPDKEKYWINKLLEEKHPLLNIVIYDKLIEKTRELSRLNKEYDKRIEEMKSKMIELHSLSEISHLILKRRKFARLSRASLSEISGVGKTVIYDIENGKESIRMDTICKIFKALNIKINISY